MSNKHMTAFVWFKMSQLSWWNLTSKLWLYQWLQVVHFISNTVSAYCIMEHSKVQIKHKKLPCVFVLLRQPVHHSWPGENKHESRKYHCNVRSCKHASKLLLCSVSARQHQPDTLREVLFFLILFCSTSWCRVARTQLGHKVLYFFQCLKTRVHPVLFGGVTKNSLKILCKEDPFVMTSVKMLSCNIN